MNFSGLGLGGFITFLTTLGAPSLWMLPFYLIGSLCFIFCIAIGFSIAKLNVDYLDSLITGEKDAGEGLLAKLDGIDEKLFWVGVVLLMILGILLACSKGG